jgi:hypothetical protein
LFKNILLLPLVSLVGLLISAACQTPAGDPGQVLEDNPLVGDWIQTISSKSLYSRFNTDGTFSVAHLYNDLEKFPLMSGTFVYEDPNLILNTNPDTQTIQRCSDETASYTVKLNQAGGIILGNVEAECLDFYHLASEEIPWEPYSP